MSQENVEIVRGAIDAFNRGEDLNAQFKDPAPDFELDMSRALGPAHSVYRLDQLERAWSEYTEAWESWRMEADELIDAGEHVVLTNTTSTRGRDGIEVTARTTWVWTFREGKIARLCYYQDKAEALEAAGLSE
jgi:ketosteroid isomerase-like protein